MSSTVVEPARYERVSLTVVEQARYERVPLTVVEQARYERVETPAHPDDDFDTVGRRRPPCSANDHLPTVR
ncbi:hypothetical protein ACQCX2_11560 [Propionibacteriaceae bacterium Y1700]|uniref:hypothetical protein n=1 Tax=Microlunatus sp. Y1700 TaxID=3418487 RepID=UPI003DA70DE4